MTVVITFAKEFVFIVIGLSVCLLTGSCKTTQPIVRKFGGPLRKPLNFGANPDLVPIGLWVQLCGGTTILRRLWIRLRGGTTILRMG